jgi:hypothetical protein
MKSSVPSGSFSPRLLIWWNSASITGLINRLMTILRFRNTICPKYGITATRQLEAWHSSMLESLSPPCFPTGYTVVRGTICPESIQRVYEV